MVDVIVQVYHSNVDMAATQIEQALVTLVPSINSLPDELVQLANALLIQSKSKAANLKSEEEIGRAYACANIACERLVYSHED